MPRALTIARLVLQPVALAIGAAALLRLAVQAYSIPSDSMSPTLVRGDHILVTRLWNEPGRGDVIVFRDPANPQQLFVKRVIATPGDHVEIRDGIVRLNGRSLAEPYVMARDQNHSEPEIIPAGSVYVLGDRRADSFDSRAFGFVPSESIVGRARLIFWSSAAVSPYPSASARTIREREIPPGGSSIRWGRILRAVR